MLVVEVVVLILQAQVERAVVVEVALVAQLQEPLIQAQLIQEAELEV
jgi:hypothetical protein